MKRFWSKVDLSGSCWLWLGGKTGCGYGAFWLNGKTHLAHRISWMLAGNVMPEPLCIDHLCRNRSCVNPGHLELVTIGENLRRGKAVILSCPKGHPYDESNTYKRPSGTRSRGCRECRREATRRWRVGCAA